MDDIIFINALCTHQREIMQLEQRRLPVINEGYMPWRNRPVGRTANA